MTVELTDLKGQASSTLGDVIVQTRDNFPDKRYRPKVHLDTLQYHLYGIDPSPYQIWVTADGIGTKPELAERLTDATNPLRGGDPQDYNYFESLAYDVFAMIESDEARWGRFLLGIAQVIDANTATPEVISDIARGTKKACDEGGFALLNGETAELGYRVSGYGQSRINWNAVGVSLINPEKLILGQELAPGQLVVGLQEGSIRSNGLTKAREILETAYLSSRGYPSKEAYVLEELDSHLAVPLLDGHGVLPFLQKLLGRSFLEQVLIPWHDDFPKITRELLKPSTLYGMFMYAAQNGIDGERDINIVAAAHISGGGVPEKVKRMVEVKRLGAHLEPVFPDPTGVEMLLNLAQTLPNQGEDLINDRSACEQWNRGIGFVVVVKTEDDAEKLCDLGQRFNIPAMTVGEILGEPKIEWRGHTWTY